MATAGSGLRLRGKDGACGESPLLPTLARRIAALLGQGPATHYQPTPRWPALACRVAALLQAAEVWKPVESPRPTSERERERFEAQKRVRNPFVVFSCGVVEWGFEVSGANFCVEEVSFEALGILSQAKSSTAIMSKDAQHFGYPPEASRLSDSVLLSGSPRLR